MTLVRNRASRIYARRVGALERMDNGNRRLDTDQREADTNAEILALHQLTSAGMPEAVFTRKSRNFAEWSVARKARQSGKLS